MTDNNSEKMFVYEGVKYSIDEAIKEIKVMLPGTNTSTAKKEFLFEDKKKPKFVGFLQYKVKDKTRILYSLPKFLSNHNHFECNTPVNNFSIRENSSENGEELKNDSEDKELIKILEGKYDKYVTSLLERYKDELSVKDPLFKDCEERFGLYVIARKYLQIFNEYGPYMPFITQKSSHLGRKSWSETIARMTPDYINDMPIYTNFVYSSKKKIAAEITYIESAVLKYFIDRNYIDESELAYDLIESDFNFEQTDHGRYLEIIEEEQLRVYDEDKLERLNLLASCLKNERFAVVNSLNSLDEIIREYAHNGDSLVCKVKRVQDYNGYIQFCLECNNLQTRKTFDCHFNKQEEYSGKKDDKEKEEYIKTIRDEYINKTWSFSFTDNEYNNIQKIDDSPEIIYGVANFNYVLELLLGEYFDSGIKFNKPKTFELSGYPYESQKTIISFESNLLQQSKREIHDMNDDKFRPNLYHVCSNSPFISFNNETRTNTKLCNFIDVAFDFKSAGKNFSVIIDAKNYGYEDAYLSSNEMVDNKLAHKRVQSLPKNESIYKQFYYEDIMSRIYRDARIPLDEIKRYNAFVLPWFESDVDHKFDGVFNVDGLCEDDLNGKSIFVVRVNVGKLIDNLIDGRDNIEKRRMDFIKLMDEYLEHYGFCKKCSP